MVHPFPGATTTQACTPSATSHQRAKTTPDAHTGPTFVTVIGAKGLDDTQVKHPGNLCYIWASPSAPRHVQAHFPPALEYPKAWNTLVSPPAR